MVMIMGQLENIKYTDDIKVSARDVHVSNLISQLKWGKAAGSYH